MGAAFIIISIFYSALLLIVYFTKDKEDNNENKTYGNLLITNFIGLAISLISYVITLNKGIYGGAVSIINKLYLIYLLTFSMLFLYYTFLISFSKKLAYRFDKNDIYKKVRGIFLKTYFALAFALLLLPIYFESNGTNSVYSYGPGSLLCMCMSTITIVISLIFMILGRKNIKKEKFVPLICYTILLPIAFVISYKYKSLFLTTPVETFIVFLMYFTIENPDLKTIKDLNKTKKELEDSDSAKTKFLYNISHEIRTPLTNIIGFTDSLKEKNIDGSAKSDVENIEASANNLLEVVNKILDLSKFDKNSIKLDPKTYDLKAMLDEIADFSKEVIGNKKVQFRTSFDTELPKALKGDYKVFRQIILNIIANSIERTDAGYIEFSATTINKGNSSRIIISVEDTGGTMSQNRLDKIFVSKSSKLSKESMLEGVVADLPSTYKLVKLMNGEIMAQNVYERGLKITVAIDQEFVNIEKDKQDEKIEEKDISGKRILIVDDNTLNIKVAERLLKKYNVEVVSVTSGKECLDLINNGAHYDMILMDDMMPGMSGVETFKELKKNTGFKTPTVMLTANAVDGMREKYVLEDGFDEYIAKPIAKVELDRVINKIFR